MRLYKKSWPILNQIYICKFDKKYSNIIEGDLVLVTNIDIKFYYTFLQKKYNSHGEFHIFGYNLSKKENFDFPLSSFFEATFKEDEKTAIQNFWIFFGIIEE